MSDYRCEGCNCQWGTGHEPGCSRKAVRLLGNAETEQTTLEGQDKLRRLEDRKGLRRLTEPAEDLTEPEEDA